MKIVWVSVRNFRGIQQLDWSPSEGVNCLIGPGDSTKTTILDAIEIALNPRPNFIGEDADFYNLDFSAALTITVTVTGIPKEFLSDSRYGLYLRGWSHVDGKVVDEPGAGLKEALSIRFSIDPDSLEGRWIIFNDRVINNEADPPSLRYQDARLLATTRIGPYAERHLGWGRQSVLSSIGDNAGIAPQLVQASRAARKAFREGSHGAFSEASSRAEQLSKLFAVPVREKYSAELDVRSSVVTAGGIALHDAQLPLRTLGTGSSRLIVSALQHEVEGSHVAIVDEVEHGLEPHRIARLLKFLRLMSSGEERQHAVEVRSAPQIFMTTHSPVVIRELNVEEIYAVRSNAGATAVHSVYEKAKDGNTAQRHLRESPDAFLARRVLIGEGKTECGLMRGLDSCWSKAGKDSFALQGVIPIHGNSATSSLTYAEHLLDLGYSVLVLLDSDVPPSEESVNQIKEKGGTVLLWADNCSTEERIFLDVPWATVRYLVAYAVECKGDDSVLAVINNACTREEVGGVVDLSLPASLDTEKFRRALGKAAKSKNSAWFKDISRGERVAELIFECLEQIRGTAFVKTISQVRKWIDA